MTMLVASVVSRIDQAVPALTKGVEYVADLAALVEQGVLPQREVAAFVLPLGFDDVGGGSSSAGAHIQNLSEAIGVVLVVRAPGDAKARKALPRIDELVEAVQAAIAGWTPGGTTGVLNVVRGRIVSVNAGATIYQLDFKLTKQLRIM